MTNKTVPFTVNKAEDGKTAEVNLYGEIVESRPIDFWTDQPVDGLFIALDEFMEMLDGLKDANDITFHINSIGGDVSAGVSIYNRIKGLKAHVTTVVDGIAASAASIIAQAGDTRLVSTGTQTMIHGASAVLLGYYNTQDITRIANQLNSTNEAIADIYSANTGKDTAEILRMMKKETWMTADEAVENGFADDITGGEPMVAKVGGMDNALMINGVIQHFKGIPMPDMAAVATLDKKEIVNGRKPSAIDTVNSKEEEKAMTIKELRESYPDLVKQITDEATTAACAQNDEAVKAAVEADRARIKEIDSIAQMVGDPELVNKAKYDEPVDAKELALKAMQAQAAAGNAYLEARSAEMQATEGITPTPNGGMEDTVATDAAELKALVNSLKEDK